jgi:hypothetical protein
MHVPIGQHIVPCLPGSETAEKDRGQSLFSTDKHCPPFQVADGDRMPMGDASSGGRCVHLGSAAHANVLIFSTRLGRRTMQCYRPEIYITTVRVCDASHFNHGLHFHVQHHGLPAWCRSRHRRWIRRASSSYRHWLADSRSGQRLLARSLRVVLKRSRSSTSTRQASRPRRRQFRRRTPTPRCSPSSPTLLRRRQSSTSSSRPSTCLAGSTTRQTVLESARMGRLRM